MFCGDSASCHLMELTFFHVFVAPQTFPKECAQSGALVSQHHPSFALVLVLSPTPFDYM